MDEKELLDNAIKALESLRDKKLLRASVDTSNNLDGEFNLNIDIDYYDKSNRQ
ncbi:MAG TPA: hypothetical protein VK105_20285 [Virgibacillus sp.]|nr:hypothetical protein [Virgibacillus sp.]HLR69432.1 hypothetical protein [Virgibacillus sp.]